MMETGTEQMLRIVRDLQPDYYKQVDAVARLVDPSAFVDDWQIHDPDSRRYFETRLEAYQAAARTKADRILEHLGLKPATPWREIFHRMREESEVSA
jgi:hypothetical protein